MQKPSECPHPDELVYERRVTEIEAPAEPREGSASTYSVETGTCGQCQLPVVRERLRGDWSPWRLR
jgi:hypothetical protein